MKPRFDPTFNFGHVFMVLSMVAVASGIHYQVSNLVSNDVQQDAAIANLTANVNHLVALEAERIRTGTYHSHPTRVPAR